MPLETLASANVKQAVQFFGVTSMEASLRFYVDGLGFKMKRWWIPDEADGHHKRDGRIWVPHFSRVLCARSGDFRQSMVEEKGMCGRSLTIFSHPVPTARDPSLRSS